MDMSGKGIRAIVCLTCSLMLAACGGGGGSSSSTAPDNGIFNSGTGFDVTVNAIAPAVDGSGDIYIGGSFSQYRGTARNRIVRINNDGSLDTGFDPGTGFDTTVYDIVPLNDGSGDIYVAGSFNDFNGVKIDGIARINSDGSLDAGFTTPGNGFNLSVRAIALTTDGSGDIYVGGSFSTYGVTTVLRIARLNDDGSLDTNFDPDTGFPGGGDSVRSILLSTDGSGDIIVGGVFSTFRGNARAGMARIDSSGADVAGFVQGSGFGVGSSVENIVHATDGSGDIYVGGTFTDYAGAAGNQNRIVRLNNDGTLDTGFSTGSGFDNPGVFSIAPTTDGSGDIYVGGEFTTYRGNARNHIARVNSDGSNDGGFDPGTGFEAGPTNTFVTSVVLATDGSNEIYVGGEYTLFRNAAANRIARVNSTGSPD